MRVKDRCVVDRKRQKSARPPISGRVCNRVPANHQGSAEFTLLDSTGLAAVKSAPVDTLTTRNEELDATHKILPAELPSPGLQPGILITQQKAYEIVEELGEGGMGRIYKAYDASMDRYVALKVLKPEVPERERLRFHQEALIAANFSHPNLVRVLEVGESHGVQWMAMEHLRGRDLGHLLGRGQPIAFRLLLEITAQALDALHYTHQRSIVHCDIKPENLFVTRDLYDRRLIILKLIDFGISRVLGERRARQEYIMGDPRYMPPEQSHLDGHVDPRTDLYSLGMTFFEAATMRHPFDNAFELPVQELLRLQREQDPPPPSMHMPAHMPVRLGQALDRFVAKACAKAPERRFPNALSMKAAIEDMQAILHEVGD